MSNELTGPAKCTCGVTKTYGAGVGSSLHSDWCDISPMGLKRAITQQMSLALGSTIGTRYCNWKHLPTSQNRKAAVKIASTYVAGTQYAYYACQDCIDDYNTLAGPGAWIIYQFWDLNDPNAPTP